MMLETPYVRPISLRNVPAFELARLHYLTLPDLTFEDDVLWYLKHGWLHSSPTSFAMGCVINIAPVETDMVEPAWFIRYAIGDLEEILRLLPCYFRYIVWCRDNEDNGQKLRKWRTERLFAIASKLRGARSETGNGSKVVKAGSTPVRAETRTG